MESQYRKIFLALQSPILCEHKIGPAYSSAPTLFHNHDGYEIVLYLDGPADYYIEGNGKHLERGDLICISPYIFHCIASNHSADYERVIINLSEKKLRELSSQETDLSACFFQPSAQSIKLIKLNEEEIEAFCHNTTLLQNNIEANTYGSDLLTNALIIELLVMISRHCLIDTHVKYTNIMPKIVSDTFDYLALHMNDFSMEGLSAYVQYNRDYINRCFKAVTGTSIRQYIVAKKVTLAQELLINGCTPCDACYGSGFHNYSNFSRTFSKQTGLPPLQYQLHNQRADPSL